MILSDKDLNSKKCRWCGAPMQVVAKNKIGIIWEHSGKIIDERCDKRWGLKYVPYQMEVTK